MNLKLWNEQEFRIKHSNRQNRKNQSFSRPWKQSIENHINVPSSSLKRKLSATSHSIEKLAEKSKPPKNTNFHSIPLPEPKLALVGHKGVKHGNKVSPKGKNNQKSQIWSHVTQSNEITQNDQFFQVYFWSCNPYFKLDSGGAIKPFSIYLQQNQPSAPIEYIRFFNRLLIRQWDRWYFLFKQ